jgi:hypothetical protein
VTYRKQADGIMFGRLFNTASPTASIGGTGGTGGTGGVEGLEPRFITIQDIEIIT